MSPRGKATAVELDRAFGVNSPRPQTLLLTLFGRHVDSVEVALSSSSVLAMFERLGVSEDAARSTLTRMVSRGYVLRHRRGRLAYFSLTRRGHRLLIEGRALVNARPVRDDEDAWTLLSFSIPEEHRRDRHSLRSALSWGGFGLLRNGLWIAPGRPDLTPVITALDLEAQVEVFVGEPAWPSDTAAMVASVWDLDALAAGYRGFLERWSGEAAGHEASWVGPLAEQIRLLTEWRLLAASDPRLPRRHLPADWPAMPAHELFLARHRAVSGAARVEFGELAEAIDVPPPDDEPSRGAGDLATPTTLSSGR